MAGLDFRILGPLEVWRGDERVPVEASRERAILAVLLLGANRVVAADRLTELVWGDDPPPRARNTVHTLVWRLRRRLASPGSPEVLLTQPPGYLVRIEPDQLDLHRFERLLDAGQEAMTAGRVADAERLFGQALGLWRGQALADVAAEGLRRLEEPRLEELQLRAVEARVEAQLALGRHGELIGELRGLVADHRLREALSGHLMMALYRSGRQAEALETYRSLRAVLAQELGVEPGPALRRLHQAVLRADRTLDLPGTTDRALDLPGTPEPVTGPPADTRFAGPVPALLPADVPTFTGRARELRALDDLLDRPEDTAPSEGPGALPFTRPPSEGPGALPFTRPPSEGPGARPLTRPAAVVITAIAGTAGVGKTALAVRWAHRVRDRFADGQLYVNLRGYAASAPMRPIDALSRFLRALGVPAEQVPHELEEAADLYRSLLADRRVLVILDNARGPDQVRPLLPGGSGCLVLITSRDRLGGLVAHEGAHRLTLDVLPSDEAHTLLARVVGAERVAAEPAAAEDLVRACAYLPLALRIAGANLINHPHHRLADYLNELRDGNRLASLEVDGDEQAAVRNNFDLSYTGLPASAQRVFRLLGLVPGPDATAEAAAALADVPRHVATRELDRLAGAHLISESAPARYAFHDLLRLYAAEHARLEESDADLQAAVERLYDWYLRKADAATGLLYPQMLRLPMPERDSASPPEEFDDHARALAWLDAERANLLTAATHAARHGPRPYAWLLADALRSYVHARMYTIDWLALAHAALSAAQAEGNVRAESAAELSLGGVHMRLSRYSSSTAHYTRAVELARQTGWVDGQSVALGNLGAVHHRSGRLEEALAHFSGSLELARQTKRIAGQASGLGNLGAVYRQMGRLQQAAEHHTEAIALFRQIGARMGEAIDLANLADMYHDLGHLDQALEHFTQALALHRELGNRGNEADALRGLAGVHRDMGGYTTALELADAALTVARDTDDRQIEADVFNTLGTVHQRLGRHQRAVDYHRQALELARETTNHYCETEALIGLAEAHEQPDQAYAYAQQALTITRQTGYRLLEGKARTALARSLLARRQPGEATRPARQALEIHRETGHRLGQARALLVLGQALHRAGQAEDATRRWREAQILFQGVGSPEADLAGSMITEPGTTDVGPASRRRR